MNKLCNNIDQSNWTDAERQRARQNIGLKLRTSQNVFVAQTITQGPVLELNHEFENDAEYHGLVAISPVIELQNYAKNKVRLVWFIGERSNPSWVQVFNVDVVNGSTDMNQNIYPFNWIGENIVSPYNTFNSVFEDIDDESTVNITSGQNLYLSFRGTVSKES